MKNNIKGLRKTSRGLAIASNGVLAVGRIANRNELAKVEDTVVEDTTVEIAVEDRCIDTSMFSAINKNAASERVYQQALYEESLEDDIDINPLRRFFKALARSLR